mmetsp:Transcript_8254/g.18478  ORF Transcript_8254/g.18478 Transcript_8254/m.18478 type:complete len:958 (+) Transcript_8254:137-3010(+)
MEAHCHAYGPALIQRAIFAAVNVTTDSLGEVLSENNASAVHQSLQEVSIALASVNSTLHAGATHAGTEAMNEFWRHVALNATNTTAVMQSTSRDELVRSLGINVCVFVTALLLWTCCCHGPIFRDRAEDDGDKRSNKGEVPMRNYLLYLQVSVYTCVTLSVLNMLFLMQHGLIISVFLRGESVLSVSDSVTFEDIFLMTFLDGAVVLGFSELFQKLIEVPEQGAMAERLNRTVWLQGLPTHDALRWWAPFRLNDIEVGRVQRDLVDALNDNLRAHRRGGEELLRGTTTMNLGGFSQTLGAFGNLSEAPSMHMMAPNRPTPIDLKETEWRCHLDDGNPYYINITTGIVQWAPPEELLTAQGRQLESPFVQEVQVAVVVDTWKQIQDDLHQAREYTATYEGKYQRYSADLRDAQRPVLRRLISHPAAWWYWRRARHYEQQAEELEFELEQIREGKKMVAGSAFVTLKESRHRDFLLRHDSDELAWWILPISHAFFSFGRPPFASVTLSARRAPHPSDIIWQNLHVSKIKRSLVFWILSSILLFVMVVVITVVRISEFVVPVVGLIHAELDQLERNDLWQEYVPEYVQQAFGVVNIKVLSASVLEQMPSLVLLFINAVMLPLAIDFVISCERTVSHSQAEHARMLVNFFFLFTNTVIVPFCGVASLNELLSMFVQGLKDSTVFEPIENVIFASNGYFALKYLMSAALFSNVNQLLQLSQHFGRWLKRTFIVVTVREKEKAAEPWPFYWGYWYAWNLSIFSLGITVSVACPSTLPVTAVFFSVKYLIDRYNLQTGIYASGTDIEGSLAFRVVRYMRFIVALWWIAIGACAYAISKFDAFAHHQLLNDTEKHSLWVSGIIFMAVGTFTFLLSWWLTARQLTILQHSGHRAWESSKTPSFWHALGEVLCLVRSLESRMKPSYEDHGGTGAPEVDVDYGKESKDKDTLLRWNGPELLGLEEPST